LPGEAGETDSAGYETFSAALLLKTAEAAGGALWRPDWPPELPPDAFRALRPGEGPVFLSAELLFDSVVYRFSREQDGRVKELPFLLKGELIQAKFFYNDDSLITRVVLESAGSGEGDPGDIHSWVLEVLEYEDSRPSFLMVSRAGAYSFVLLKRTEGEILEAWYDPEAEILAVHEYTLRDRAAQILSFSRDAPDAAGSDERYYFDSRGLLTGISGSSGEFSVLYYLEDLPRYWEYRPAAAPGAEEADAVPKGGRYSFQWDEKGLLVRLTGTIGEDGEPLDRRYEYTLDERGNWIERREIRMVPYMDLLAPLQGPVIKRNLVYGNDE
jgi:hypothetical protein